MWDIKKLIHKGDYLYALVPDHPNATKNGYVLAHRVVMENYLGRLLTPDEIVHHKNHDKFDNRIENLELTNQHDHARYHGTQHGVTYLRLKCPWCEKVFIRQKRHTHLRSDKYQFTSCSAHCRGCFSRYIQMYGYDERVNKALQENIIEEFISYENVKPLVA